MKNLSLVILLSLSTTVMAQSKSKQKVEPKDVLSMVCANLEMQSPEAKIKSHKDRLEIFSTVKGKKVTGYKVAGYGELERVNALENQGLFDENNVDGGFGLKNAQGDLITVMSDSDQGSKAGTILVSGQEFELQCVNVN